MAYSYSQLVNLYASANGLSVSSPEAMLMGAIGMAESSGVATAHNPSGASGFWQIMPSHVSDAGWTFGSNFYDPVTNARMAYFVLHHQGYGAWTTYTNGAYKQYEGGSVTVQPAIVGENVIPGLGGGTNGQPYTLPNGQSLGSLNPLNPSDWAKAIGEGLTAGLGTLLGGLIDVAFWKRVGMGLLGIVIMVIGLTILLRRDIAGAVRTASGTAAVAA